MLLVGGGAGASCGASTTKRVTLLPGPDVVRAGPTAVQLGGAQGADARPCPSRRPPARSRRWRAPRPARRAAGCAPEVALTQRLRMGRDDGKVVQGRTRPRNEEVTHRQRQSPPTMRSAVSWISQIEGDVHRPFDGVLDGDCLRGFALFHGGHSGGKGYRPGSRSSARAISAASSLNEPRGPRNAVVMMAGVLWKTVAQPGAARRIQKR